MFAKPARIRNALVARRKWRRSLACVLLLAFLAGCSVDQPKMMVGVWSNAYKGKLLDVSPNGFYADVFIESQVRTHSWEIKDDDELTLFPLCTLADEKEALIPFRFEDDGLEFPGDGARYVRYVKEELEESPRPELVGLWFRETLTRKREFIEFTPWTTIIWNRWDGKPGSETLTAGWANYVISKEGHLLISGVEDGKLLKWPNPVRFKVEGQRMTLRLPKGLGKREYVKTTRSDLIEASHGVTR